MRYAAAFVLLLAALLLPSFPGGAGEMHNSSSSRLLEWPMLPGESLTRLAQLIYPDDADMQRKFVKAVMRANPATFAQFPANRKFEQETLIWLPDLKQLSSLATSSRTPRHFLRPLLPAFDAAAMRATDELMARNLAIGIALARLDARLRLLEQGVGELREAIAHDRRRRSQPSAPVPEQQTATSAWLPDSLASPSPLHLLTIAGVALTAGGLLWLRRRRREQYLAPPVPMQMPAAPQASAAGQSSVTGDSPISVDEISSIVEEAKVFVALGRSERAIEVLQEQIAAHPQASATPWLYLMDIYRGANRKEDFTTLAKRFHQALNVMAPQWDEAAFSQVVISHSLEEFPHIMGRLARGWGTRDAQDYLNHLVQDNRGGERVGFSMDVLQDILLLLGILELRGHLPELRPFQVEGEVENTAGSS